MTVNDCGVSPSPTYYGISWNLMYCLSAKLQRLWISSKLLLKRQEGHSVGSCTLAWSSPTVVSVRQLLHRKKAVFMSGYTSEARITMPRTEMSRLMFLGPRLLMLVCMPRCLMPTINLSLRCSRSVLARSEWLLSMKHLS